jgi:hypothetical protein
MPRQARSSCGSRAATEPHRTLWVISHCALTLRSQATGRHPRVPRTVRTMQRRYDCQQFARAIMLLFDLVQGESNREVCCGDMPRLAWRLMEPTSGWRITLATM